MWPLFSCSWPLFDDHMECEKWSNVKNIAFFELPDQTNVCFDRPQVYSALKNNTIHVTTFFMLMTTIWWPHRVWKVVKCQKYCLFWASWPKNVCFDMSHVYSAIKNHKIHLTTFFMLMTTIWWPLECEKWSNVKNIPFLSLLTRKVYILICDRYIVQRGDRRWSSWPHKFEIWPQNWSWPQFSAFKRYKCSMSWCFMHLYNFLGPFW